MAIFPRLLAAALALVLTRPVPGAAAALEPRLGVALERLRPGEELSVIAVFDAQPDLEPYRLRARDIRRAPAGARQRHRQALVRELRKASAASAPPLERFLAARGARSVEPLWVINAVALTARREVIEAVAGWPGVAQLRLTGTTRLPDRAVAQATGPAWNLAAIRAPDLWNLGFTGQGVVIGALDSGVDVLHADLGPRWRGGDNSWFDPYAEHPDLPYDGDGHGTAVMGVLVGGSAGGTAIGVAPDARWIAAKIFNDAGVAEEVRIHQSFQWLLDPDGDPGTDDAPDVVNNSWGLENLPGTCVSSYQPDVDALKAAGIAVVFSAGNTGGLPGSDVSPANYAGAFAVGAVDQGGAVPTFSARGPSACDGALFPVVAAPGVQVRTADLTLGGTFPDAAATVSGTSFSAPHVAGAMALLLSAFPGGSAIALEAALQQTATDLGAVGPDNAAGSGRIDALAAYDLLNVPAGVPRIAVLPTASFLSFGPVAANETAARGFSVVNVGSAALAIGALALDGPDAAAFGLQNELCSDRELAPAAACTFEAVFSPPTAGRKDAGIALPSNDPAAPQVHVLLSGNDQARIGTFRRGAWFLDDGDGHWEAGSDGVCPSFGAPGDLPVTGDWNGDGKTEIGTYRRGTWYLDNGDGRWEPGTDTVRANFGAPADLPVTGDWNGDGTTDIGVYRGGAWFFDSDGSGDWDPALDTFTPAFGAAGDVPVTGDWDGDGKTQIGTYRQGLWYLDFNGNGRWDMVAGGDRIQAFGAPDDIPVTLDRTNDGKSEIAVYRPATGAWYLDDGSGHWVAGKDLVYPAFGLPTDRPVTGVWR